MELDGKKIAILVADLYEDVEFWYPYYRMKEAGAEVMILGPCLGSEEVHGKHGVPAKIEKRTRDVSPDDFDAVIIPGGYAPDLLRRCPDTLRFVKTINDTGKVTAAICHAGWVLISAGIMRGKRATSFFSIKDDMINAGANWVDEDVVVDGNMITSRSPQDLPAFCRGIIRAMISIGK
ncbi:MAG: type 1 glutamine amidotransferase domain-containing protein [Methanotrichaceae archaeon]